MPIPKAAAMGEGPKRRYGDNVLGGILAGNLARRGQPMKV
jgi:hypothetical protein